MKVEVYVAGVAQKVWFRGSLTPNLAHIGAMNLAFWRVELRRDPRLAQALRRRRRSSALQRPSAGSWAAELERGLKGDGHGVTQATG